MIDVIELSGLTGPVKATDWDRFEQIAFLKKSSTKFKKTRSYYNSPFTGAQFHMTPTEDRHREDIYWRLNFRLPVAAVLAGQNIVHDDATNIKLELKAIGKFLRLFLLNFGFTPTEVEYFMGTTRIEYAELTWHTCCRSLKAARDAQRRLLRHVNALRKLTTHAYDVCRVHVDGADDMITIYVHVNEGQLKCYLKIEQAQSRDRAGRDRNFLSEYMRRYREVMLSEVSADSRQEAILEKGLLKKHGLDAPEKWTEESVLDAIADLWEKSGLDTSFIKNIDEIGLESLHPNVRSTAEKYFEGHNPKDFLDNSSRSRHGDTLRERGLEIGVPWSIHKKVLSGTIGKQLEYGKRRRFPENLRRLSLCAERLHRLIEVMDKEIEQLVTNFSQERYDMRELEKRQRMFMRGNKDQYVDDPAATVVAPPTKKAASGSYNPPRQPLVRPRGIKTVSFARGVGSVPVDPKGVDELIYAYGEWRVI